MSRKSRVLSVSVPKETYEKIEELRKDSSRSELIRELITSEYQKEHKLQEIDQANLLESKIKSKEAVVAVIGLGYVGLPLALAASKKGFKVIGYDKNTTIVKNLNDGISHTSDIESRELRGVLDSSQFEAKSNPSALRESVV